MHEYSIASALLRTAEEHLRKHGSGRVVSLALRIGELSGVEVPLLEKAWSLVRERSACAECELSVTPVAARWRCRSCDETVARGGLLRCASCGGPARLAAGDELVLDRIEMEVS